MARKARYTKALPVYVTPEVRGRLDDIADLYAISVAEVTRTLIHAGLEAISPKTWRSMYPDD